VEGREWKGKEAKEGKEERGRDVEVCKPCIAKILVVQQINSQCRGTNRSNGVWSILVLTLVLVIIICILVY